MLRFLLPFVLVALLADPAAAALIEAVSQGSFMATSDGLSRGFAFTPNAQLIVTELGFFDLGGMGLSEPHPVGIFDAGGSLLVSTTVSPSDPLAGSFRYTPVAPTSLSAGATYYAMAVTGADYFYYDPQLFWTAPEITFIGSAYTYGGSGVLGFPDEVSTDLVGYFGPNATFSVAPEPSAVLLIAGGLLGLVAGARRTR